MSRLLRHVNAPALSFHCPDARWWDFTAWPAVSRGSHGRVGHRSYKVDASAFDPETGLVFYSNGDGTVTVLHQDSPNKYTVVETVKTQVGSKTMALDGKTHQLFLPAAKFQKPAGNVRRRIEPGTFAVLVFGR